MTGLSTSSNISGSSNRNDGPSRAHIGEICSDSWHVERGGSSTGRWILWLLADQNLYIFQLTDKATKIKVFSCSKPLARTKWLLAVLSTTKLSCRYSKALKAWIIVQSRNVFLLTHLIQTRDHCKRRSSFLSCSRPVMSLVSGSEHRKELDIVQIWPLRPLELLLGLHICHVIHWRGYLQQWRAICRKSSLNIALRKKCNWPLIDQYSQQISC